MKSPERDLTTTLPSAENGSTGLHFGVSHYRRTSLKGPPTTFHTVSLGTRVNRGGVSKHPLQVTNVSSLREGRTKDVRRGNLGDLSSLDSPTLLQYLPGVRSPAKKEKIASTAEGNGAP